MINNFITKLKTYATGKNVLIFFTPAYAVYFLMILYTIPQVKQYAPGMALFDLSPLGYSYEYAIKLLDTLGEAGRDTYLTLQLPVDFIYPALFAISSCLLIAWLFQKANVTSHRMYYLCIIPLVAGLFDYLENIQTIRMLMNYPVITEGQVALGSLFTIGKSGLTTLFFLILIVSIFRLVVVRFIKNK